MQIYPLLLLLLLTFFVLTTADASKSFTARPQDLDKNLLLHIPQQGNYYGIYRTSAGNLSSEPGDIFGRTFLSQQGNHRAFLGIPFANYSQRFDRADALLIVDASTASSKFEISVFDASTFPKACAQISSMGNYDEFCLHLNIYMPHERSVTSDKLPILFFAFGGAFMFGDGYFNGMYDPRLLFERKNFIFVTFNTRVGVFGTFGGNQAYSDVKMALKWVVRNAHHFGGDASRVTLMGMSSGSSMVSYLLVDPTISTEMMRGWSFVLLSLPVVLQPRSLESAYSQDLSMAVAADCLTRGEQLFYMTDFWLESVRAGKHSVLKMFDVMDCMRSTSSDAILRRTALSQGGWLMDSYTKTPLSDALIYGLRIDNVEILDRPLNLLSKPPAWLQERLKAIRIMFGFSRDEVGMFTDAATLGSRVPNFPFFLLGSKTFLGYALESLKSRVGRFWFKRTRFLRDKSVQIDPKMIHNKRVFESTIRKIFGEDRGNQILQFYGSSYNARENLNLFVRLLTDVAFHCPARQIMDKMTDFNVDSRIYLFSHHTSYFMPWFGVDGSLIATRNVDHATDLPLYFGVNPPLTGDDVKMGGYMIDNLFRFIFNDLENKKDQEHFGSRDFTYLDADFNAQLLPPHAYDLPHDASTLTWKRYAPQPTKHQKKYGLSEKKQWLVYGEGSNVHMATDPFAKSCDFLDQLFQNNYVV